MEFSRTEIRGCFWFSSAYLVFIFVFAGVYYYLYRTRAGCFAFNSDVLRSQIGDFRLTTESTIENRLKSLEYLSSLLEELRRDGNLLNPHRTLSSNVDYIVTSKYSYRFSQITHSPGGPAGPPETYYYVTVFNLDDKELTRLQVNGRPKDRQQVFKIISEHVGHLERDIEDNRRRLQSLTTDWPDFGPIGTSCTSAP